MSVGLRVGPLRSRMRAVTAGSAGFIGGKLVTLGQIIL
jgi:hypothetical protein